MLSRWNLALGLLTKPQNKLASYNFTMATEALPMREVVKYWTEKILQRSKPDECIDGLTKALLKGKDNNGSLEASDLEKSSPH